jgi:glyoxylase-like metal-dependent hydrolase (beta-lactamase superfamily II)
MGRARAKLATLGIAPADIATILVTHAHVDHVSGLVDPEGKAFFPNAEIVVNGIETDLWLDDAKSAAASDAVKGPFANTQGALVPALRAPEPSTTARKPCRTSPASTSRATPPAIPAG